LAWSPDGRLFYAERSGTIRVFQGGTSSVVFATVPTVTTEPGGGYSERGLLGLAVSSDRHVFAFYSHADYAHQVVVRWDECAGAASNEVTIATYPSGGDCCHKGGRLAIGPDHLLYVTLGDEHTASAAQDTCDARGKILRYTLSGAPAGSVCGAVYAYGLRNPFGIALAPDGRLFVTNNGPSGDAGSPRTGYDTAVLVKAGEQFQWPACYGYSHSITGGACPGNAPDWSSEASTVVPTGAAYADSGQYVGHFVFCTYNVGMLIFTPGSPGSVTNGPSECRLDVKAGPDHALYYSNITTIFRG
jgi:glucose/arabinose dehydrogenase